MVAVKHALIRRSIAAIIVSRRARAHTFHVMRRCHVEPRAGPVAEELAVLMQAGRVGVSVGCIVRGQQASTHFILGFLFQSGSRVGRRERRTHAVKRTRRSGDLDVIIDHGRMLVMRVQVMMRGGDGTVVDSNNVLSMTFRRLSLLTFSIRLFLFRLRFLDLVGPSHLSFVGVNTGEATLSAAATRLKTVALWEIVSEERNQPRYDDSPLPFGFDRVRKPE